MIPPMPQYSPRSFSDHLVALRGLLLACAFAYVFFFLAARLFYLVSESLASRKPPRGFDVIINKQHSPTEEGTTGVIVSTDAILDSRPRG